MAPNRNRGLRGRWTAENMDRALGEVQRGMSVNRASITYAIPRRTLRRYVEEGKVLKSLMGRRPVLTEEQETELSQRIVRLAEIGYPLTSKVLRRCVYQYTKTNGIHNPFRQDKEMAGRYWLSGFMKRNPQIRNRKAQNLNPARAQKLNRFIVNDHFSKLEQILNNLDIIDKPERIYNIDEKGCRLSLHHQQKVLAKKGARRVHVVANEHGQNVTIVACGNAIGAAIPPMVLFKGKRMKPEWGDSLPPGGKALMTPKGSMNTEAFVRWIEHFAKFKVPGTCLLIFDGAKSHLDYSIVEAADRFDMTLYCLPSNTTHELQPMDKAVFRAFEYYWDDEVMKFYTTYQDRSITKQRFGILLSKVWDKAMTPCNIKSGFSATGIYPFNRDAISELAFAPSTVTHQAHGEVDDHTHVELEAPVAPSTFTERQRSPNAGPSTSGMQQNKRPVKRGHFSDESSDSEDDFSLHDSSSDENFESEDRDHVDDSVKENISFTNMLYTPDEAIKTAKKPRQPAINGRAQVVKKDPFKEKTVNCHDKRQSNTNRQSNESWFCKVCQEDRVADMRLCSACKEYIHEECVGLTSKDKLQTFICPDCEN